MFVGTQLSSTASVSNVRGIKQAREVTWEEGGSMQGLLCALVLLLSMSVVAQQQGQPPPNSPPHGTPPTFPEERQAPGQMPPDQNAPAQGLSNREAAQQIQQGLKSEPALHGSDVAVHVDTASVVLGGTIQSEEQRDLVLRIAHSYSGERRVVDKLKLKQQN